MRPLYRLLKATLVVLLAFWLGGLLLFRFVDPPGTPLMVIRSIENGALVRYKPVALSAISPALVQAVIAAEDGRFCFHHGIDIGAVQDALDDYEESGRLRGASTITMQVARNLFLWPGGGFLRKAIEAPLALALDALWPKRRIIEVYLNIAEMGDGVFGVDAAARRYFGKPPARLTVDEAARLAAVLPNPVHWSAARPTAYIKRRAAIIRSRIGQLSRDQQACTGLRG
jgi:monofunctional biosynthetic peptidoglycan transglycosylase